MKGGTAEDEWSCWGEKGYNSPERLRSGAHRKDTEGLMIRSHRILKAATEWSGCSFLKDHSVWSCRPDCFYHCLLLSLLLPRNTMELPEHNPGPAILLVLFPWLYFSIQYHSLHLFPLGHWTALSVLYWEPLTSICFRDDWGFSCVERPTFPHPSTQGLSHIYNWLLHQYLQMEWMEPDTQIPTENGLTVSVRKCCCMGWNRVTIGNMDGCLLRGHCWTKGITAMDWQEVTLPESLRQDLLTGHTVLGGLPKFLFMPIKMFDSVFPQDAFLTQSV